MLPEISLVYLAVLFPVLNVLCLYISFEPRVTQVYV
jgi:hypothetical protein